MCVHSVGSDPRHTGSCVKCGKLYEPELDPARDLLFESHFMFDALEMAHRLTGISNPSYPAAVYDRLDIGRERYGDGDFLTKNCIDEVREETPDLAAYAMLELQRQRHLGLDDETFASVRLDLVAVTAYGAVADYYAQRAARRLQGDE